MNSLPENDPALVAEPGSNDDQAATAAGATGPAIIFIFLILALLINIVPLKTCGPHGRMSGYPAMIELANAGIKGVDTVLNKRGLYLALEKTAPGTAIILPAGCPLDRAQFYGLGRASQVSYQNYNPATAFKNFDPSGYVVAEFKANARSGTGPFAIVKAEEASGTMILLKRNRTWYMVDASLLPG